MRILLVGSRGSIGKRYHAILNFLQQEVVEYDPICNQPVWQDMNIDKAIIASPTNTHIEWCKALIRFEIPFVCEKPVSKDVHEIMDIKNMAKEAGVDARMTCNYKFALMGKKPVQWDYFNTGTDGLYWDLIQLIYLNPDINISTTGVIWQIVCDGGNLSYRDWEMGFYDYVQKFLFKPEELWDMNVAMEATKKVLLREGR